MLSFIRSKKARPVVRQVLIVLVAAVVLLLVARTLGDIRYQDVLAAIRDVPATVLAQAIALALFGYIWLIGYDFLALRYLRKRVPYLRLALTSLAAFALQRNVGPAPLTGGALRYRYYSRSGLSAGEAAVVTVLCGFAFTLGIVFTAGAALLSQPQGLSEVLPLPPWAFQIAGAVLLVGLFAFIFWSYYRQRPLRVRTWKIPPPSINISLLQLLFGVVDIAIVAGVAYLMLPDQVQIGYPTFVGLYVLAMTVGALSHVPAGLGVFEGTLLLLLPGADKSVLLGALLAFRGVYYLLPLAAMGVGVGCYELISRFRKSPDGSAGVEGARR